MLVYLLIKILISGMCCCGLTNRVNEKRDSVFNKWGADVPADSHLKSLDLLYTWPNIYET